MGYHEDWIMRMIKDIINFIAKIAFNKDMVEQREEFTIYKSQSEINNIYEEINRLLEENNINDAEDILFENAMVGEKNYLYLVLNFYEKLNKMTDDKLKQGGFSREEIKQGIFDILRYMKIDIDLDMFFS